MLIRFTKAKRGVDSQFKFHQRRVLVALDDLPAQPTYPENPRYWQLFEDAVKHLCAAKTRSRYIAGVAPCLEAAGLTRADLCAEAVHKDWVSDLMKLVGKAVTSPWRDLGLVSPFTDKGVLLDNLISHAGWMVSPSSFAIKDHFKVPRPEEVAGAIARKEIDCPDLVMVKLRDIPGWDRVAQDQRSITMYPEGSPDHGSWNAMHSAAASAQRTVIAVMKELTDADAHHNLLTMENVGGFRKSAFVHTEEDNVMGYWLGQFITEKWLPDFIESIGGSRAKTIAALEAVHIPFEKSLVL